MRVCDPNGSDCGDQLACVCGVCAATCAEPVDCMGLSPSAECVANGERPGTGCGEQTAPAICDVRCGSDDDCAILGAAFRCSEGFCRTVTGISINGSGDTSAAASSVGSGGTSAAASSVGSGGTSAVASSVGSGGTGAAANNDEVSSATTSTSTIDPTNPNNCPRGEITGNEVVVLGDVFVAQTGEIPAQLEVLAKEAGSLSPDDGYRDFSSSTHNSLSLQNALLLDSYAQAQSEGPVKAVVMNGGGTDALARSCDTEPTPECPLMVDAAAGAETLLSRMAADGVQDVVWFYYPGPSDDSVRAKLDVLRPLLQDVCENAALACHWVELRPIFEPRYTEYMQGDYVPTTEGARAAASAIWDSMRLNCVAQ